MFRVFSTWIIGSVFFVVSSPAYSERVGFEFEGMLLGGQEDISLFGIEVLANSPISGTFAYDTTVTGVDGPEPRSLDYPQTISGGFSLRIGSAIHLSASEYFVEVTDDFEIDEGEFVDVFSVQFARHVATVSNPVLLVNGEIYSGQGFMQVMFTWPGETYDDPMEPQLTANRPISHEADRGSLGFVGQKTGKGFLAPIVTLVPILAGDYNSNGTVDMDDYAEWKAAFGSTGAGLPADGNINQIVDAADYTVWRDNASMSEAIETGFNQGIPEPTSLSLAAIAATLIMGCRGDKPLTLGRRGIRGRSSHVDKSWHHIS